MQISTHGIGKLSPKSTLMIRMMTIIAAGVIPFVIAASTKMNTIRGYRGQESRQLEHDQCDSMITNGKFEVSIGDTCYVDFIWNPELPKFLSYFCFLNYIQ